MGERSSACNGRKAVISPQFAEWQLSYDPELGVHAADDCSSRVVVSWRNILWLLKNSFPQKGGNDFASRFDLSDVLQFQGILHPPNFGCLTRKGSFSTATGFFNSLHRPASVSASHEVALLLLEEDRRLDGEGLQETKRDRRCPRRTGYRNHRSQRKLAGC